MNEKNQIDNLMKWNCSTIFLLYPLGLNRQKLNEYGFIESYLKDEYNNIDYNYPLFLRFKPTEDVDFQTFVDNEYFRENPHTYTFDLREDYDRGNGEVVLVYEYPEEFRKDYDLFLEGKYSKFSSKFVKTYPKTIKHGGDTFLGSQYRIITKDRDSEKILAQIYGQSITIENPLITMSSLLEDRFGTVFTEDMELWQKPNLEKETLKL